MGITSKYLAGFFPIQTLKTAAPNFLSIPLSLICIPILLAALGTEQFGLLVLIAVTSSYSHVILFGLERAVSRRLVRSNKTSHEIDLILCVIYLLCIATFCFSFTLFSLVIFLSKLFGTALPIYECLIFLALSMMNIIWHLQKSVLLGFEKFGHIAAFNFLHQSSYLFVPTLIVYIFTTGHDLTPVLYPLIVFRVLLVLTLSFKISPNSLSGFQIAPNIILNELKYAKWLGLGGNLYSIQSLLDRYAISITLGNATHAYFALVLQVTQKLAIVPQALSTVMFVKFSKKAIIRQNNFDFVCLFFLLISIIYFLVDEYFFSAWLGNSFSEQIIIISPPCFVAMVFLSLNFMVSSMLEADGNARVAAVFESVVVFLYVVLVPVLGFYFGIECVVYALLLKEIIAFLIKRKLAQGLVNFGALSSGSIFSLLVFMLIDVSLW